MGEELIYLEAAEVKTFVLPPCTMVLVHVFSLSLQTCCKRPLRSVLRPAVSPVTLEHGWRGSPFKAFCSSPRSQICLLAPADAFSTLLYPAQVTGG